MHQYTTCTCKSIIPAVPQQQQHTQCSCLSDIRYTLLELLHGAGDQVFYWGLPWEYLAYTVYDSVYDSV